ncbi:MAG: hypothetical protein L6R37_001442 [Teloschistes peruensis]|nr:MAG: hypothetical protein L6R37_001442 [Teloschistes peruensis]
MSEPDVQTLPFSVSEDLVPSTTPISSSTISIDFDGILDPPLLLQVDPTECGGQLWPAGMVLAKYLLRCKMDELREKTMPSSVHLTDLARILPITLRNMELNGLMASASISADALEWAASMVPKISSRPDVLLAADCVYFEPAFPLLLQTMQELMGPETVCYFCFKKRRRADMNFVKMARKVFDLGDIEDDPEKEVWEREGIHLYVLAYQLEYEEKQWFGQN